MKWPQKLLKKEEVIEINVGRSVLYAVIRRALILEEDLIVIEVTS